MEAYKLELVRITSPIGNLEQADQWDDKDIRREVDIPAAMAETAKTASSTTQGNSSDGKLNSLREKLVAAVDEVGKVESTDIESPFQTLSSQDSTEEMVIGPITAKGLDFTKENIDKVLEEVRPYLIADGGNVAVVSIDEETRGIQLLLQGACGSCPSSTTTMKMGIERVLKENFAYLGPITAVDSETAAAYASANQVNPEKVQEVVNKILPAIQGMGGLVAGVDVALQSGVVTVNFQGPARLKKGIELALKDVDRVTAVVFEDVAK
jgi:Fe-S cluster biogenesis protein NfuA